MNDDNMIFEEVALRKESVDRNVPFDVMRPAIDVSLSARRAWIEIMLLSTVFLRL